MSAATAYSEIDTLLRAKDNLKLFAASNNHAYLLYSALDVRLCIERTLFIYLIFIKNLEISRKLEKLYSAKDLKAEILNAEPNFYRKLALLNIFLKFLPYGKEVATPDLDLIGEVYGRINNYLHTAKRPEETWDSSEWWQALIETLSRGVAHLEKLHLGIFANINLNETGQSLFDRFVAGEISENEVEEVLKTSFATSPMTLKETIKI